MKLHTSHSLEETGEIASDWLKQISEKYSDSDEALVVGLSGHLGAGKTAFVKCVAKELGIKEEITSPTFVIMKIYDIEPGKNAVSICSKWRRLVHIDAYRLENRQELDALDWEKLVADPGNLILMEWPENIGKDDFVSSCNLKLSIEDGKHLVSIY